MTTKVFEQVRETAFDMKPLDAVDYLLSVLADMMGATDETCIWPDIHLTQMQRVMLQAIFARNGGTVTRDQFMAILYTDQSSDPSDKIIDVQISKLRQKLSGTGFKIVTDWGVGYHFEREIGAVFPWEEGVC